MEMDLVHIWETMSWMAKLVAIALFGMGIASLAVSVERWFVLNKAFDSSAKFADKARILLEERELELLGALTRSKEFHKTPLARLIRFGLDAYDSSRGGEEVTPVEMARRELGRRLEALGLEARRGMSFLASTGSTAPFIGLFGTVIGIINAFQGIAAAGGGGLAVVSAGIAEALIVTALGLIVAITAVLIFNYLTARFDKLDMSMQHAANELIDYLEGIGGERAS